MRRMLAAFILGFVGTWTVAVLISPVPPAGVPIEVWNLVPFLLAAVGIGLAAWGDMHMRR